MASEIASIRPPVAHCSVAPESVGTWGQTAEKISQFFTSIEGKVSVFALLAGAVIAVLWGVQLGLIAGCAGFSVALAIALCRNQEIVPVPIENAPVDASVLTFATQEDMEARIREVTPHQIEMLAKCIVGPIMTFFQIDITEMSPVKGEYNKDLMGDPVPIRLPKYNPDSRFMSLLFPIVANKIQQAFANPSRFIEHGLKLQVYNKKSTGIMNQIIQEYGHDFTEGLRRLVSALGDGDPAEFIESFRGLTLILKASKNHSAMISALYFSVDVNLKMPPEFMRDGQETTKLGMFGFTIEHCERYVHHSAVAEFTSEIQRERQARENADRQQWEEAFAQQQQARIGQLLA